MSIKSNIIVIIAKFILILSSLFWLCIVAVWSSMLLHLLVLYCCICWLHIVAFCCPRIVAFLGSVLSHFPAPYCRIILAFLGFVLSYFAVSYHCFLDFVLSFFALFPGSILSHLLALYCYFCLALYCFFWLHIIAFAGTVLLYLLAPYHSIFWLRIVDFCWLRIVFSWLFIVTIS